MEDHQHTGDTYSANGKIVCADCHAEEDKGGNECFHSCHNTGAKSCMNCAMFHKDVTTMQRFE